MSSYYPHCFTGQIEHHDLGTMRYTVIWLTGELAADLPFENSPRLRISGELNDVPLTGAWQPSRGRWYLMLGKPLLRQTGLGVGSLAELRFRVEPPEEVDVPALLQSALAARGDAGERFSSLTPGKQRALAHFVGAAKTSATATKRVAQCLSWLLAGETDMRSLARQPIEA